MPRVGSEKPSETQLDTRMGVRAGEIQGRRQTQRRAEREISRENKCGKMTGTHTETEQRHNEKWAEMETQGRKGITRLERPKWNQREWGRVYGERPVLPNMGVTVDSGAIQGVKS